MITILTDGAAEDLGQDMYKKIVAMRQDIRLFCMEKLRIEPCYACRGCEEKTYGRCVIRDDADLVLPYLSRSTTIVVFSAIVFGGYSFPIKRIVDRFSLIVDKHYHYHGGELTKGKYPGINYHAIGIHDGIDAGEVSVFKQLVMENIKITAWVGKPLVLPNDADEYKNLVSMLAEP